MYINGLERGLNIGLVQLEIDVILDVEGTVAAGIGLAVLNTAYIYVNVVYSSLRRCAVAEYVSRTLCCIIGYCCYKIVTAVREVLYKLNEEAVIALKVCGVNLNVKVKYVCKRYGVAAYEMLHPQLHER